MHFLQLDFSGLPVLPGYLTQLLSYALRYLMGQLRISSHTLAIETGRYQRIPREMRRCLVCHLGEIEDEFHFFLRCPAYYEIWGRYRCLYRDGPHTLRTFFAYLDSRCLALLIREMFSERDTLIQNTPLDVLPLQAVDPVNFPR